MLYIYICIYVSFMIIQRWKLTLPPARMKSFMAWSLMVTWLRLQKAATNLERRTLWDRFWQCGWGRPCGWRSWWRHRACMLIYSDTLIYFGQMSCWLSMIIPILMSWAVSAELPRRSSGAKDNFEWEMGYSERFGCLWNEFLWETDPNAPSANSPIYNPYAGQSMKHFEAVWAIL